MPDPSLQTIAEDDGLDGYEEISKMARIDERLPHPIPASPSNVLGDYEEIIGLKPEDCRTGVPSRTTYNNQHDKTLSGYDEIEDVVALKKEPICSMQKDTDEIPQTPALSPSASNSSCAFDSGLKEDNEKQKEDIEKQTVATSNITERSDKPKTTNKLFQDLTNEELVDRLKLCNLSDLADTCRDEKLDGAYFTDETPESLKETFMLQGIKLAKFLKMRDENWVSK